MSETTPTLRENLRSLPGPAWILFAGSFINRFGSFVVVFLILYLRSKGYSIAEAGVAVSAYGVGALGASAVGGYLADRLGRRRAIAVSMFSAAASLLAMSQAEGLFPLTVLTGAVGLTAELYRPASSALLADLVPAHQRVAAFAAYRLAINAGFAIGPATAGFLADRSFFYLFLGDAMTSVVFGIVALIALPEGVKARRSEEVRGEALRAVLADRTFLLFCLATMAVAFVYFQNQSTFALHVRDAGLSNAAYGSLVSLNGAIVVLLELPLTSFTQRLSARPVMAFGSVLTGLGFALTAMAHSMPALAATVLIWTLGEIGSAPIAAAYVAGLAPAHLRGRYLGTWGLTFALALVVAPVGGTALYANSPTGLWLACGALGLVSAALILTGPSRKVEPTLVPPEAAPRVPGGDA